MLVAALLFTTNRGGYEIYDPSSWPLLSLVLIKSFSKQQTKAPPPLGVWNKKLVMKLTPWANWHIAHPAHPDKLAGMPGQFDQLH